MRRCGRIQIELQRAFDLSFVRRGFGLAITEAAREHVDYVAARAKLFHHIAAAEFIAANVVRRVKIGDDQNFQANFNFPLPSGNPDAGGQAPPSVPFLPANGKSEAEEKCERERGNHKLL